MDASRWWLAGCLCAVLSLAAACDSAPGPEPPDQRPPVLSDFSYSPQTVLLAQWPPDQVEGDQVLVPLDLSVVARDPDGQIDRVEFIVNSPVRPNEPLATGTLAPTGTGNRYATNETIGIPQAEVGTYTVLVFAVDDDALLSGEMRGAIRYSAEGRPPVLEDVEAPSTVERPAAGETTSFPIVAVVSDPDGLGNVAKVEFWNVNTPNQKIPMFDDGDTGGNGDAAAGDGRYTRTVFLTSSNQPGVNTFAFQATDRSGLTSNVVEKQIEVK